MINFDNYLFIEGQKIYLHRPQGKCSNKCRGHNHIFNDLATEEEMKDGLFYPEIAAMGVDWGKDSIIATYRIKAEVID